MVTSNEQRDGAHDTEDRVAANQERPANARFVERLFEEGWNARSFDFLDGRTSRVIPFRYNGVAMEVTPESLPPLVEAWHSAFADLHLGIRHVVSDGDLVAVSLTVSGTHRGEWEGMAATGRHFEVEEMMFFRFEDGVLVEMWELFDADGMKRQLEG